MRVREAIAGVAAATVWMSALSAIDATPINGVASPGAISREFDPAVFEEGLLDLGAFALATQLDEEPPAIRRSNSAVVQTLGFAALPGKNKWQRFYASGFNIQVNDIDYTVTAGHVTNWVRGALPITCYNQWVTSPSNENHAVTSTRITNRLGLFTGTDNNSDLKYTDLGVFKLPGTQTKNKLSTLEIRSNNNYIPPGTLLYDTNYEPVSNNGDERNLRSRNSSVSQPDQVVAVVLGVWDKQDSDTTSYAVLPVKAYEGEDAIYDGASGSPYRFSNGFVAGIQSSNVSYSIGQISEVFGITIPGNTNKKLTVNIMQAFDRQDVNELIQVMGNGNSCPYVISNP